MDFTKLKIWIRASRPHTLPLAFSCISAGNLLAWAQGSFNTGIFILSLLTGVLLQILSNLANDYGDFIHGADTEKRQGPARTVQSGLISPEKMKKGIKLVIFLSLISGLALLGLASFHISYFILLIYLLVGLLAMWAAWNYTASSNPYGYRGLGDFFVLLFFGPVAVVGPYILQTGNFSWPVLLPSFSYGLLSTAVLNLNNLRDIESDREAGKFTMAVRWGKKFTRIYHALLILTGWSLMLIYLHYFLKTGLNFWVLFPLALFVMHIIRLYRIKTHRQYYVLLKELSLMILISTILLTIYLLPITN